MHRVAFGATNLHWQQRINAQFQHSQWGADAVFPLRSSCFSPRILLMMQTYREYGLPEATATWLDLVCGLTDGLEAAAVVRPVVRRHSATAEPVPSFHQVTERGPRPWFTSSCRQHTADLCGSRRSSASPPPQSRRPNRGSPGAAEHEQLVGAAYHVV